MSTLPESFTSLDDARERGIIISDAADESSVGPLPLVEKERPAEPYPIGALLELYPAARAIRDTVQVPDAVAGSSVLAAASLASQALANVETLGEPAPLSLFCLTVADSGDRKSSADAKALKAVEAYAEELEAEHRDAMKSYRSAFRLYEEMVAAIKKANKTDPAACAAAIEALVEPEKPLAPTITVRNATMEGLIKSWKERRASLGLFTAEGGQFFGGHSMREEAATATIATLSEIWDGRGADRFRAGDESPLSLRGVRLAAHFMVQRRIAMRFIGSDDFADQGVLARFLLADPGSLAGTRKYRKPDPADLAELEKYGERLDMLLRRPMPIIEGTRNQLKPPRLPLSPKAWGLLRAAYDDDFEPGQAEGGRYHAVKAWAGKAPEQACRIAAVIELFANPEASEVSDKAMEAGITLARWYVNEALRLRERGPADAKMAHAERVLHWLRGQPGQSATMRAMTRHAPRPKSKRDIEAALKILVEHDCIEVTENGKTKTARATWNQISTRGDTGDSGDTGKNRNLSNEIAVTTRWRHTGDTGAKNGFRSTAATTVTSVSPRAGDSQDVEIKH